MVKKDEKLDLEKMRKIQDAPNFYGFKCKIVNALFEQKKEKLASMLEGETSILTFFRMKEHILKELEPIKKVGE